MWWWCYRSKALKAWPHLLDAVGRTVNELDLYSPSGKKLRLKLKEPFAIYSRLVLDSYLRDRAQRAGAQVFQEKISVKKTARAANRWVSKTESRIEYEGRVLVGADGANQRIRQNAGRSITSIRYGSRFWLSCTSSS